MLQRFSVITPRWLDRASYYTGSVGPLGRDFRYRFQQDTENQTIKASVYSRICYEKATDVQEETFPWDEEGIVPAVPQVEDLLGADGLHGLLHGADAAVGVREH